MENENRGVVQISDEVISVIAATAAKEVEGVASLVNSSGTIMEKLNKKTTSRTKGVGIEINEGQVSVDVSIMAYYNCKIREVAQKVQENIKNAIETMTGLKVNAVNVIVADIDFQREAVQQPE